MEIDLIGDEINVGFKMSADNLGFTLNAVN
jgi:hypothetical protein